MGGTNDGNGNAAPAAEANFKNDPEAAKAVFASFVNVTVAGLNATRQVSMHPFRDALLAGGTWVGQAVHAMTQHYVDLLRYAGRCLHPCR